MTIVQLLPELNEGGVERGVVELNREFVKKGIESFVISLGGKLENQISLDRNINFVYKQKLINNLLIINILNIIFLELVVSNRYSLGND